MEQDHEFEARLLASLREGQLAYGDAARLVFRRLCAVSGTPGLAVGSGDFAVPLIRDLAGQPEIERAYLFGLSRRVGDMLAAELGAEAGGGAIVLDPAGLGRDGGKRLDDVLEGVVQRCAYMALHVPAGDLAPLEGAAARLKADAPVLLAGLGEGDGAAARSWTSSVRACLEGMGYCTLGGFGQPLTAGSGADGTGVVWGFRPGEEVAGGRMISLALAKAAADAEAVFRPI